MEKKRKILIPVDFSDENRKLFEFAGNFFAGEDVSITLLHVVYIPVITGDNMVQVMDFRDYFLSQKEAMEKNLLACAADPLFKGAKVDAVMEEALDQGIGAAIAGYAGDNHYDLILISVKHRKGLESVVVGTELYRTLRHTRVPVLALRADQPVHAIRRIAFAMDFSPLSLAAWQLLQPLATYIGAEIKPFVVNTVDDFLTDREFVKRRNQFIEDAGISSIPEISLYNDRNLESGVSNFLTDSHSDLLALTSHARKGISRLLGGSAAEEIIQGTRAHFLYLPHR